MFTLYRHIDIEWQLTPEDYPYVLSPNRAMDKTKKYYDLDLRHYSHFGPFELPDRLYSRSPTWRRAPAGYSDPVYKTVKASLEIGRLIGVNTMTDWDPYENPFYVDADGEIICDSPDYYHEWFIREITDGYNDAVANRNGVKAAPTQKFHYGSSYSQPDQHAQAAKTLNSKAVGRLLAAGGVYNGNIEGYARTAQQLGGDAPAGYDQVLNETTAGSAIAVVSVATGLGLGRLGAAIEMGQLERLVPPPKINGFTIEQLSDGAKILDKGDLTQAGRALQKHGGRIDSVFPPVQGNTVAINEQGQSIVDNILNDTGKTVLQSNTGRFGQVTDIIATDGRGLRYDLEGKLIGFLEPPK